jgi:hypothetical protein
LLTQKQRHPPQVNGIPVGQTMKIEPGSFDSPRSLLELERFREGAYIHVSLLGLRLCEGNSVEITIWTQWSPQFVPDGGYEKEALEAPARFRALQLEWPELAKIVQGRDQRFQICYDYGMGGTYLGRLNDSGEFIPS